MHGNFLFVRNNARRYHRMKRPVLVFNLDIMKAFDSIRWDYLMALLQQHGFPPRWRKWVGALLSTSTSQVVLIGIPGHRIQHGKGLWQGDPLSALLFILAFDPLQSILGKATELGALTKLQGRTARLRTSMYAVDAVIFVNPPREDVIALTEIL